MKKGCFSKAGRIFLFCLLGLLVLVVIAGGLSAIDNRNLPSSSQVVDQLGDLEKARLAEFYHLQQNLGDQVWPGWENASTPFILYNEKNAFLVGYPDPPPGWIKMPQKEHRGALWEPVPDDSFDGQTYYRQRLADPEKTPEGFTVLVGERWTTTFQTMEYSLISFHAGIRDMLPPFLREIVPYRLIYKLMIGDSAAYITILAHEAFHSYQAMSGLDAFLQAEGAMRVDGVYPYDDALQRENWQEELDILVKAAKESDQLQAVDLARQFLEKREERRTVTNLSPELVAFERQREWLEGLAKYAELSLGRVAAKSADYQWLPVMDIDSQFNSYRSRERAWSMQLDQVNKILNNEGEIRFYYSGFAQAVLLDKLMAGWKENTIPEGIGLEDLLRTAITQP